jgi:4-hydroxybenzoate polyprenyltransferase
MTKLRNILILLRPNQWYKNLLVFLALIFSNNLLNIDYLRITLNGFLALILISSVNYILNDLFDAKKDRFNPEKKERPIASGKISKFFALFLLFTILIPTLFYSYSINPYFFYIVTAIFFISTLYTVYLKNLIFADLIAISSNFVLRAVSGAVIINVMISPWLIVGIFFFALFLVTGKRYSEIKYLSNNANNHRHVLKYYSKDIMLSLFNIFMASLFIIFALYSFSSEHKLLIWIIPIFVYIILRYYYLILSGSDIARNPERALRDIPLVVSSFIFLILSIILIMW